MRKTIESSKQEDGQAISNALELTSGGIYIWSQDETRILAGPFASMENALDAKSAALDKAIKKINKR